MPRPRKKENIAIENRLLHYPDAGEKRERNEEIVRDYLNDMSIVDMIVKYKLSWQRLSQILKKYRWVGLEEK